MKRITLKEIAEKANVSIGTVDRCLHDRGKVNEKTSRRIKEICEEFGYASNVVGKAMALQRKGKVVAVAINARERNTFSSVIHDGIEDFAASVEDYNIRFEYYDLADGSLSELSQKLDQVQEAEIDGLIVKPIDSTIIKYKLTKIREEKKIPIVTCTSDISGVETIAYVGQNHEKLGRMLACTLTKVAHSPLKILVVVGPLSGTARREKLEGFMEYLKDSGQEYDICNICEVPYDDSEAYGIILDLLRRYPDANALYIHSPQVGPCSDAIEEFGEFNGLKFSYGHTSYLADYIRNGKIDFAIYEDPYRQGYLAGEVMFNYLLDGAMPANRNNLLDGQIVFDENC